ncbi:MAG TPA: DUF222 domain-containing protein [Nocardioides sp.]|nr:DUF222 domain-containing protein [Nocardioides sp.]
MQSSTADPEAPAAVAAVRAFHARLASLGDGLDDGGRIDLIRALEELKSGAAAAQARVSVAFEASQRAAQAAAGVPAARQGRGVAGQVALARKESPHRGGRRLGAATAWLAEMPHTLAALESGQLTEWRAELMVRETALLSPEHRGEVDREVCGDPSRLEGMGDTKVVAAARRAAHRLDPGAAVRRASRAETERNVTCRPAPDTMARVSSLLPVAQGVAVFAALMRYADRRTAAGDPRTRGQLMADALVERVTGQATADGVPVAVHLVVTDATLFDIDHEPAELHGHGPVPAGWARDLVRTAVERLGAQGAGWLRRVFADPVSGDVTAMDSRTRRFCEGLDQLIAVRDAGLCRTPYCDAPIRQSDHVVDFDEGGRTNAANGQGLCQACNIAKQAPDWRARPRPGPRHTVATTTPTGHTYDSTAPPLPGTIRSPYPLDLVWAA